MNWESLMEPQAGAVFITCTWTQLDINQKHDRHQESYEFLNGLVRPSFYLQIFKH